MMKNIVLLCALACTTNAEFVHRQLLENIHESISTQGARDGKDLSTIFKKHAKSSFCGSKDVDEISACESIIEESSESNELSIAKTLSVLSHENRVQELSYMIEESSSKMKSDVDQNKNNNERELDEDDSFYATFWSDRFYTVMLGLIDFTIQSIKLTIGHTLTVPMAVLVVLIRTFTDTWTTVVAGIEWRNRALSIEIDENNPIEFFPGLVSTTYDNLAFWSDVLDLDEKNKRNLRTSERKEKLNTIVMYGMYGYVESGGSLAASAQYSAHAYKHIADNENQSKE